MSDHASLSCRQRKKIRQEIFESRAARSRITAEEKRENSKSKEARRVMKARSRIIRANPLLNDIVLSVKIKELVKLEVPKLAEEVFEPAPVETKPWVKPSNTPRITVPPVSIPMVQKKDKVDPEVAKKLVEEVSFKKHKAELFKAFQQEGELYSDFLQRTKDMDQEKLARDREEYRSLSFDEAVLKKTAKRKRELAKHVKYFPVDY